MLRSFPLLLLLKGDSPPPPTPPPTEPPKQEGVDPDQDNDEDTVDRGETDSYIMVSKEYLETLLEILVGIILILLIWNCICTGYCCYKNWKKRSARNYKTVAINDSEIDSDVEMELKK